MTTSLMAAKAGLAGGFFVSVVVAGLLIAPPAQAAAAPNGKALFEERCGACHTVRRSEPQGMAPPLGGVVNSKVAAVPGWGYTSALRKLGGHWTPARLDAFLANPEKVAPGTSMGYQEAAAPDRKAIIQYLKTLGR